MKVSRFLTEPGPDDTAKLSITRLVFFVWAIGVLVVWIRASWKCDALASIPDPVIYLLGILMTGKVVQRFAENP